MPQKLIFKPEWKDKLINEYRKLSDKTKLIIVQDKIVDNPASNIYIRNKMKFGKSLPNVEITLLKVDGTSDKSIKEMQLYLDKQCLDNAKIMLQKPCSPKLEVVFKSILNNFGECDIEGVSLKNQNRLFNQSQKISIDDDLIIPCTALSDLILLNEITKGEHSFYDNKNILIIGRSEIVGKPLRQIFVKENCTLILANSYTENLQSFAEISDVIISCAGVPDLVKTCKTGAILIDNGCTLVEGKQHGDIACKLWQKSSAYTPYINATGKTTVLSLFINLLKLSKKKG